LENRIPLPRGAVVGMVTAILPLCAVACSTEPGPSTAVVTDSSGVQIVESIGPVWSEGSGWRLSDQPALNLGVLDGDPAYQFYEIRGAWRLTDGRIVVADGGASELRYFDSNGAYLLSVGEEGGGPGEFGSMGSLSATPGDTVVVLDGRNRRISYFDPSGAFIRSVPLQFLAETGGSPTLMTPFDDGTLIIGVQNLFGSGGFGGGLTRGEVVYVRCDTTGALMDTLAVRAGMEMYTAVQGDNRLAGVRPFGRSSQTAAHSNGFFLGGGDTYEIEYRNKEGVLLRSIRQPVENMQVTQADLEAYRRKKIENAESERQRQVEETLFGLIPFPESYPAYRDFVVDADGNLWVGVYRRPDDDQPRWTVFDTDGRMLGEVQTPDGFTIFQIGRDFVLGRWADELEVHHVVMYELLRGGR